MLNLPTRIIQVLRCFEEAFSERVWEWAKVLLIGAILTPGERTVTAILRAMGLSEERQFQNYHRVGVPTFLPPVFPAHIIEESSREAARLFPRLRQ